jgi:hypothetical protein
MTKKKASQDGNTLFPITKESDRKRKFAIIDVEAQNWIEFVVAGIFDGKNFFHTKYLTNLMLECFRISTFQDISEFFAHFGGKYDFLFFLKEAILNSQFKLLNIIPRGSGILQFDLEMDADFCLSNDLEYFQGKITFRDSSALLPFSLESACKSFGVKNAKTYFDYNFVAHSYKNEDYFPIIMKKEAYEIYYDGKMISTWEEVETTYMQEKFEDDGYGESIQLEDVEMTKKVWKQVFCNRPKDYDKSKVTYKILTDKKSDWLHKIYNRQDILDYLEMDLKALHECLTKFYEWELVAKVGGSTTIAGQALKVLRWFLKKPLFSIVQPSDTQSHLDEFVRAGYFGGRTEIFKPLYQAKTEKEKIYCYDVNSLYPTVMARNSFPNKFKKWAMTWEDFENEEFGYWKCDVEVPEDCYFPVLGVSHTDKQKNTRFIFPTGKFSGTWPACELKYAISQGTKIINLEIGAIFHDGGDFFKPFIDYLYEKRLQAKRDKDAVGDIMCKLLMNSCYGKTGIDVFGKENLVLCEDGEFNVDFEIPLGDDLFACLKPVVVKLEKTFNNVAIAGWVTALARIHLHKILMKAGKGNVYYSDTDSAYCTKILPTGKALGDLKEEYSAKEAVFILPKTYYIGDGEQDGETFDKKVTMKGFDKKKTQAFNLEDFTSALEGDLRLLRMDEQPKVATFKTALRYGELLMMKNDPVTLKAIHERKEQEYLTKHGKKKKYVREEYKMSERAIKSSYNKRIIIKEGWDTKPIHIG